MTAEFRQAAFRQGPVTVTVAGLVFRSPSHTAEVWLDRLSRPEWMQETVQALDTDSHELLLDALDEGTMGVREVKHLAHAVLAEEGGRPWWETERLAAAGSAPDVLGSLLLSGVDPARLRLASFCATVWVLLARNLDEMKRMQLEADITVPPADATDDEIADAEDSGESTDQLVSRLRGMPGMRVG